MKVEIWSDIGCPFCYIGKQRFEDGLGLFASKDKVNVEYRSFQLDPYAEKYPAYDVHDLYVSKHGGSREEAKAVHKQFAQQAKSDGVDFQFDRIIPTHSLDAHRLIKFAGTYGKSAEVLELLYKAYFTDSKHIGDADTLADIAAEAGMDREKTLNVLESTQYVDEVRADGCEASSLGATGVPFFVINRKYAISGAQSSEVFLEALQKVWDEEHPLMTLDTTLNQESGNICEDGYCTPKNS